MPGRLCVSDASLLDLFGPVPAFPRDDLIPPEMQAQDPVHIPGTDQHRQLFIRGNQPAQDEFLCDGMPGYCLAQGGWGSGKSYIGARKFAVMHRYNQCPGLLVAPTWADMARLMVPQILAMCQEWTVSVSYWPHGKGDRQYPHMVLFGEVVYLFSGDAPERITGVEGWGGWGDESARFAKSDNPTLDTRTQVVGRIRHKRAKSLQWNDTTTPEGMETQIQLDYFGDAQHPPKPNHRAYFLRTLRNRALPPDVLETYKSRIPASLHDQYLNGIAVSYAAKRAHPNYVEKRNMWATHWRPNTTVHIGCDFNVSPMCWVAGQFQPDGTFAVLDEIVLEDNALVDEAMRRAHKQGWGSYGLVDIHPDKSSKNRSTTGSSEILALMQAANSLGWRYRGDAFGANPPVSSRINNLERCLFDMNQKARLTVHPRCTVLRTELERTARKADGSYDPGADKKRGHILDALGYLVWDVFPIVPGAVLSGSRI